MRRVTAGVVTQLWRYPVKSMMGERLDVTTVGAAGIVGDRAWATRDEARGGIRGAKKIGALMRLSARYASEPAVVGHGATSVSPAVITLPDGSVVATDAADVHERVSRALDHPVTLWPLQPRTDLDHYRRGKADHDDVMTELRAMFARNEDDPLPDLSGLPPEVFEYESPPGTYFDAFPLLVLSEQSLASLARLAPESRVDVRRFRPNVVVSIDGSAEPHDPFPERSWIGRTVQIGGAIIEVVTPCPRCVMITRAFADLPQDRSLMKSVIDHADDSFGVYARVVEPGPVALGDPALATS